MSKQLGIQAGVLRAAAVALMLAGILAGCADQNDNSARGITVNVSFQGQGESARSDGLVESPAAAVNDPLLSLIVGAVVITHDRDPSTPEIDAYTSETDVTETLKEELKDDAIQSAAYLTIEDLPFSGDTISFLIPPGTAGNWQLVGVGSRIDINVLQDLEDHTDAAAWYGFSEGFQNGIVNPGDEVSLEITPGCSLDAKPAAPACP